MTTRLWVKGPDLPDNQGDIFRRSAWRDLFADPDAPVFRHHDPMDPVGVYREVRQEDHPGMMLAPCVQYDVFKRREAAANMVGFDVIRCTLRSWGLVPALPLLHLEEDHDDRGSDQTDDQGRDE